MNRKYDLLLQVVLEPLVASGLHPEREEAIRRELPDRFHAKYREGFFDELLVPQLRKILAMSEEELDAPPQRGDGI